PRGLIRQRGEGSSSGHPMDLLHQRDSDGGTLHIESLVEGRPFAARSALGIGLCGSLKPKPATSLQSAGITNILAIRFMRLGDVTLLLPALAHLKACYPGSRLTLLTDERCAPLAEMCPSIDEVITVNRLGMRDGPRLPALNDMAKLVADVRRRRFDLVIDFL